MPSNTSIEWTEKTWNPVTGCTKVSPGCDNCYAERITRRFGGDFERIQLHPDRLDAPKKWRKPATVFVNSMSDLFHPLVPFEFVEDVFRIMEQCPQHTFQILTKRPSRMKHFAAGWPGNVWAGTSIESAEYRWRTDQLRQVGASVRFLSVEPLLGPVGNINLDGIDWVIVGGESGPGHRPIQEEWILDIKSQCDRADVSFFFKQWGGRTSKANGRSLLGRTWDDMPHPTQDLDVPLVLAR